MINTVLCRQWTLCLLALIFFGLFSGLSKAQVNLPDTQTYQGIAYITGGIGSEESEGLLALGKTWPLTLEFSQDHPQRPLWVADVLVKIVDQKKKLVFEAMSDGPILLLKLAPGKYEGEFSYEGKVLKRPVTVEEGKSLKQSIVWPR